MGATLTHVPCMHQRNKLTRLSKKLQLGLEARGGLQILVMGSILTWIRTTWLPLSRQFTSTLQCKVCKERLVKSFIVFKLLFVASCQTNTVIKTLAQSRFNSLCKF